MTQEYKHTLRCVFYNIKKTGKELKQLMVIIYLIDCKISKIKFSKCIKKLINFLIFFVWNGQKIYIYRLASSIIL